MSASGNQMSGLLAKVCSGGEAGIRTLDRGCLYTLSRRAPSTTRPPLLNQHGAIRVAPGIHQFSRFARKNKANLDRPFYRSIRPVYSVSAAGTTVSGQNSEIVSRSSRLKLSGFSSCGKCPLPGITRTSNDSAICWLKATSVGYLSLEIVRMGLRISPMAAT